MENELEGMCVIFDNDGVVVETEPGHFWARQEALRPLGIELTKEEYIRLGISRGHREFLVNVVPVDVLSPYDYDRFFREEIQGRYHEWRKTNLRATLGFAPLLQRLRDQNVPLAIASTQPKETVVSGLRRTLTGEEFNLFRVIVSGEEVKNNKPAPDVYLRAAELAGFEPKNCVAVEDSVSGVKSAKAAGMICVARRNDWAEDSALRGAGADAICQTDYSDWPMLVRVVLRGRRLGRHLG